MSLPETITYKDAVDRYQCCRKTLEKAVRAGEIDAFKPGGTIFLGKESADKWWISSKVKPVVRKGRPRNDRGAKVTA